MGGTRRPFRCQNDGPGSPCPINRHLRRCALAATQQLFVVVRRRTCVRSEVGGWRFSSAGGGAKLAGAALLWRGVARVYVLRTCGCGRRGGGGLAAALVACGARARCGASAVAAACVCAGPKDDEVLCRMTHLALKLVQHRGKSQILRRVHNKKVGVHTRQIDAPPESLCVSMRFHRKGIYAHAAPHSLVGSISRASTLLRALSTRKRPNREKWTSKIDPACASCSRITLVWGR